MPWEQESADRGRSLGTALPSQFGRFQVRGLLGKGSWATVYRAFDPVLEREVALKVPSPGASHGARALARFGNEARALARLRHRGIVAVFEAGRFGELPYLATDYIEGRTLRDLLEDGPPRFARAAEMVADLAEALAHVHKREIVHRDVKPANVLVGTAGMVLLTDFGLACRVGEATLQPAGVLVGTPAYVAPEQASGAGRAALPASDQYSLGIVLYELLCGRPPFLGPPALVLYEASRDDPIPPRELCPEVPRSLERICLKAMARRPAERYASCQALADELRRWLVHGGRAEARGLAVAGSLERTMGWLRRRPTAALSTALALIGLAASTALATVLLASPPVPGERQVIAGPSQPAAGSFLADRSDTNPR